MRMFIDAAREKTPFLWRLISIRILRSLRLVYEYFSLIKRPIPPWVLFTSLKQKT